MNDLTYRQALGASAGEVPILGPAPCQGCGAWVDWAGAAWVNAGTDARHACGPFLTERQPELVASWTRPSPAPYRMAHPMRPAWQRRLEAAGWAACILIIAAAVGLVAGQVLGQVLP